MGANRCSDLGMFRYVHDPVDVHLRSIKLFVPFGKCDYNHQLRRGQGSPSVLRAIRESSATQSLAALLNEDPSSDCAPFSNTMAFPGTAACAQRKTKSTRHGKQSHKNRKRLCINLRDGKQVEISRRQSRSLRELLSL